MELKRASLIQNTPPSTPRNSMLLVPATTGGSNTSQMFNLQEFLTRFELEDSPGVIREMEETDSQHSLRARLRTSQQSVSQVSNRSRSSSSLHSAPSTASISRENMEHHMPVIANPGALNNNNNSNNNNNNNNNNSNSFDCASQESAPVVTADDYSATNGCATTLIDGERNVDDGGVGPNSSTPNYPKAISISQGPEIHSVISWGDASSISLSSSSTGDMRFSVGTGSQHQLAPPPPGPAAGHEVGTVWKQRSYSTSAANSETRNGGFPKSTSSEGLKKAGKTATKSKGRSLFKRHFHRSSDDLLEDPHAVGNAGKPPYVQKKFHKSAFDLVESKRKTGGKKKVDFSETGVSDGFSLSGLTDLRHRGEMTNVQLPPAHRTKKTKNSKRKSLQPKTVVPSRSQECLREEQESNDDGSDELMSLTDMLSELDPTALSQPVPNSLPPSSPRSPGQDSVWQEYGCV